MREIEFWKFFFLERGKVRQTAMYLNLVKLFIWKERHLKKKLIW